MFQSTTIRKTLKFILQTGKKQKAILDKVSAKHTYGVREYLKILSNFDLDSLPTPGELDKLTIPTRNRQTVIYDMKKKLGVDTCTCQQCGRQVLSMMKRFINDFQKWARRKDNKSFFLLIKKCFN